MGKNEGWILSRTLVMIEQRWSWHWYALCDKKKNKFFFLLDIFVTIKNEEISHQKELHSHYYWWTDFNTKYFQFWKRKYDFLIPTLFFSYSKQVQIYFVIFFTECRSVKNHIHREMCESFSIVVVVAVLNYSQSPFLYIYT